jgi:hypothetical protein
MPLEKLMAKATLSPETGCLEWQGHKDDWGYGVYVLGGRENRKSWKAHRLSWRLQKGEIPADLCVLHKCDNPCCINVDHLFLGTNADNVLDRDTKGRGADHSGELNGKSILTAEQVQLIRARYVPKKVTRKHLAAEFGVSVSAIKKVVNYVNWR